MNWQEKSVKQTLNELGSDKEYGLSQRQAEELQREHGLNVIEEKNKTSLLKKFLMQFNDFMIFILLVAAGVSFFVSWIQGEKDFLDPVIILIIVVVNALLGVVQEYKAEKSIEALREMSSPVSKVIRSGKTIEIDTKELVPGDIILLKTGDLVPADARIISAQNLKAEESALTGESVPVEKDASVIVPAGAPIGDRHNMVFSGSAISYGRGCAVVTQTGMNTEMGKIAGMILNDEAPDTPLQKKLAETGKLLGIGALGICGLIFIMGLFRHIPPFNMFMTSVSLAVAAIPEGLPAIVTIMLAIGVQRMARRKAVIRKLPAVETLGSANVICSDKTGTLTQNKMRVTEVCDYSGTLTGKDGTRKQILMYGTMCNDSILNVKNNELSVAGDPTETAIVASAYELYLSKKDLDMEYPRVGEIPFDSKRKLMSTIHKMKDNTYLTITKGAPDVLINKCTYYYENGEMKRLNQKEKRALLYHNTNMADKALRVLGVAYREDTNKPGRMDTASIENNLVFLGLIGMMDPPREEARLAVKTCKMAGIKPVMVTGDHVITAKAIARKLGIMNHSDKAMTGETLSKLSQDELEDIIMDYAVFARVSPEHKVRIVKAFQNRGNVVAMTGDGVNDAPALKAADIGCAMGITGTDVAKGAADMVLLDDNFATIVDAVREGRGIYANIKKAIHFLLSSNIGEIITIFTAILMGWDTPLLAIHLLWVNLITDSLPAIALGLDPADEDAMKRKPYSNQKSFFAGGLWQRIAFEGAMIGLLALIAFGIGTVYFDVPGSHLIGRTMCFATLSISQLVHAFNMRSEKSIFEINLFENIYLIGALIAGVALQVSVIMVPALSRIFKVMPLDSWQWIIVIILCIMPIIIVEGEKMTTRLGKRVERTPLICQDENI